MQICTVLLFLWVLIKLLPSEFCKLLSNGRICLLCSWKGWVFGKHSGVWMGMLCLLLSLSSRAWSLVHPAQCWTTWAQPWKKGWPHCAFVASWCLSRVGQALQVPSSQPKKLPCAQLITLFQGPRWISTTFLSFWTGDDVLIYVETYTKND